MAISPELLLAQTPHDIALNQFATKLSRQTIPFLEEAAKYIRNRLNNEWETVTSIKRLNSLQRDIDNQLSDIYGRMDDLLFSEFQPLSVQEGQFTIDSVNEVLNDNFIMLSVEDQKLWSAVTNAPLMMSPKDGPIDFTKYVKGFSASTIQSINSTLAWGYTYGLTLEEIKGGVTKVIENDDGFGGKSQTEVDIKGVLGKKKNNYKDGVLGGSPAAVERMVRTSINHIATQTRLKVYNSNKRIVEGYRIIATLDSRTSPICQNYDQTVVMNDDKFKPYPPFHPNCVLSGTIVTTCSDVNKLFKRAYKGLVVDIVTKSGRKLSITPNHPILTRDGWKDAKLINSSDQLATIPDEVFIGKDYKNSVKAEVSDLFSAAYVSVEPNLVTNRPTTPEHFHGDGSNGEVSVIDVDGLAWGRVKAILDKKVINRKFSIRGAINSTFNSSSSFYKRLSTALASSVGVVGRLGVGASFLKSHSTHSGGLLGRSTPKSSESLFKDSSDGAIRAIKAEVICNPTNANSGFISFDDVVDVTIREADSSCHVYNLENKDNWYLSNGIITHNCRTTVIPEIKGKALEDSKGTRAANFKAQGDVKAGKVGQVPATTQYYDLLKKQSAAQQDLALGPARGKIFRNAGLTIPEFRKAMVDQMNQPITLSEMAVKNKKILKYMQSNKLSRYLDD